MTIDLDDIAPETKKDYRRANGAPMVTDPENPGKNLRYSRPSGWGKELDDESALTNWRIDTAMRGVAESQALQAKIVASNPDDRDTKKELREEATQRGRGNEASDTGTALHAMSERIDDPDDDWEAPEPFASDLAAYARARDGLGLKAVHIECRLVNDTMRTAGTADRIYETTRDLRAPDGSVIEAGTLLLGDLKTGKRLDYSIPAYTIQMALYVDSVLYDLDTGDRTPLPDTLNTRWGLLIHLPVGQKTCEFLWVDMEIGRLGAQLVAYVRNWRKRKDFVVPVKTPSQVEVEATEMLTTELGAVVEEMHPEELEAMSAWCQTRVAAIGRHTKARESLLMQWPKSVPPLREGGHDTQQIMAIVAVLDKVEADHAMPFPAGDPRIDEGSPRRSKATKGAKK